MMGNAANLTHTRGMRHACAKMAFSIVSLIQPTDKPVPNPRSGTYGRDKTGCAGEQTDTRRRRHRQPGSSTAQGRRPGPLQQLAFYGTRAVLEERSDESEKDKAGAP